MGAAVGRAALAAISRQFLLLVPATLSAAALALALGAFRRWQRERADRLEGFGYTATSELAASELVDTLGVDAHDYASAAELLSIILHQAKSVTWMACYLLLQERTYVEIADELSITERAVEYQFYLRRKRVRMLLKQGRVEVPGFLRVTA